MKIRIKGNFIRLRLTQNEVLHLGENGQVVEETNFGASVFSYRLAKSQAENFSATFENGQINIEVPAQIIINWAASNQVGFEENLSNGIKILVEKDFKCLTERAASEDEDTFPNPLAKHDC